MGLDDNQPDERDAAGTERSSNKPGGALATGDRNNQVGGSSSSGLGQPAAPDQDMGGNHVRHRVTGKEANKRERTESMRDSGQAVTEQVEKKHTFTVSRRSRR